MDKKDILIVQGDWNTKVGANAQDDWKDYCGPVCNNTTNEKGLHLLEFDSYNNLVLANKFGVHKASHRLTWHAPDKEHHSQTHYIPVKNWIKTGVNRAETGSFPGPDSRDHGLFMINFRVWF